jgi:hypothetical protein
MALQLDILSGDGLHVGSGRPYLGPGDELVAAVSRCAGTASLPGAGLKGAVRTIFEVLTGSCSPVEPTRRCKLDRQPDRRRLCPACRVFGAMGHAGHVGFGEHLTTGEEPAVLRVARGWTGKSSSTEVYRFYDGAHATSVHPQSGQEQPMRREEPVEVVQDGMQGLAWFRHLPVADLGGLFLALGLGAGELAIPLRVGGKKYDGLGHVAVQVQLLILRDFAKLGAAAQDRLEADALSTFVADAVATALGRYPDATTVAARLHGRGGRGTGGAS